MSEAARASRPLLASNPARYHRRMPNFRREDDTPLVPIDAVIMHGVKHLLLRFEATTATLAR